MSYWKDKVVFVTGASSGIGQAAAIRFGREGAAVAILARNEANLDETIRQIGSPKNVLKFVVDIKDEASVIGAIHETIKWKNRLDAAINVAGIFPSEDVFESTRQYWDDVVNTNLRGTFLVAREAAKYMKDHGGGTIVNTSSVLAEVGDPTLVTYSATKGGIVSLTKAMAIRFAEYKIRVNCVSPADVETPHLKRWIDEHEDPQATRDTLNTSYPLGYFCDPKDVADAIVFFAGPEARCITGENLVIDSGLLKKCY